MGYDYNLASPDRYVLLKEFARENKKFATEAERILWNCLSKRNLGYKFNRQHIVNDYILDFICIEKHLVIEVDGGYHCELEQMEYDEDRTTVLNSMGFEVVRFTNEEVLYNIDNVLDTISEYLEKE